MTQTQLNIRNLIVHQLVKEPNGPARIRLAEGEAPVNASAQRLIEHLYGLYGTRNGKGFGRFDDDAASYPLPGLLRAHAIDGTLDFVTLSHKMLAHLQERAEAEPLASGGYVLIARVDNPAMDFLFVALVSEVIGVAVSDAMQVDDSIHLDIDHLRVAGRVDLTSWQAGGERYVSFLRGRGDVAGYFKLFLGVNDMVTPLKETQRLVKGLESFASEAALPAPERDALFERAHSYLDELGDGEGEVDLASVAREVFPDAPERLQHKLESEDAGISSGFVPDRRAIKPLMRFKAAGPQWKVEFDRASLRSGAVIYDKHSDTLVLSNIPDELKRALLSGQE